jgi:hypothetical protein
LALETATVPLEMPEEVAGLHFTVTFPRTASSGIPYSPSSRRSSRIIAFFGTALPD